MLISSVGRSNATETEDRPVLGSSEGDRRIAEAPKSPCVQQFSSSGGMQIGAIGARLAPAFVAGPD
jgi:hypothetical protein